MTIHYSDYSPGHPWYYFLGGPILRPKQILAAAQTSTYQGYWQDTIQAADQKAEPQRSEKLRQLQTSIHQGLQDDLSMYRRFAHQLRQHRRQGLDDLTSWICDEIHQSMGFKYCHLFNGFASWVALEPFLSRQPDLFDL